MQIHELDTYSGTPTNEYLAIDDGTITQKVSALALAGCVVVTTSTFSSLPQTETNSKITEDMVCVNAVLSNPSAQTGDWTVTTSDGSLTLSGSISGSTTATIYLVHVR